MSHLAKSPDNALLIIIPITMVVRSKLSNISLLNTIVSVINIEPTDNIIISLSSNAVVPHRKCTRENMAAVIICMLTYKINSARSKIASDIALISELFLKYL